ncbi:MAG: hypothetical protein H6838_06345 [Planctomycetes bacterium]|nr:hypothetical protein [Planctomycetota bacterium]MCB9885093.1 hypothetical protein [Planctomycetota bacterium]
MTEPDLTAQLLANGPFAREGAPYSLVTVAGPDAGEFLQRLCSQDVLGLGEGAAAPAAFLDAKGKVLVTCLVQQIAGSYWLETQATQGPRLLELLERYHFTEKLTIAVPPQPDRCAEWIGAADEATPPTGDAVRFEFTRHGVTFVRAHAAAPAGVALPGAALTEERAEALRMAAGLVRVGVETEANTLALEAALDDHCSTTKGCYTGQEIVARIHTYGHVNRRLCLLRLPMGEAITAPAPLHELEDELAVGRVLHAVAVPELALRVGLGYLPKDFQAPGTELALEGGVRVRIEAWNG